MKVKLAAAFASLSIYALPLADPPGFTVWGTYLRRLMTAEYEPVDSLKVAAALFLTACLQFAACLLFWWFFKKPGLLRGLCLPAAAMGIIYVEFSFPGAFLTLSPWFDQDTLPEKADLPVECTVPGAALGVVRSAPTNSLANAAEAFIHIDREQALLVMPDCAVRHLNLPIEVVSDPPVLRPGGIALYRTSKTVTQWWLLKGPGAILGELEAPPKSGAAMLSEDGQWVAWPRQEVQSNPSVLIQRFGSDEEIALPVDTSSPISVEILQLDMQNRAITLFDYVEGFRSLDLDGSLRWGPVFPEGRFKGDLLLGEGLGWIVRHVARADDAWFFPWSPSETRINLGLRRGQVLQSAGIHPNGKFLAFSADEEDRTTISVMRVQDQETIFRRYLPRMNFEVVVFLGDRFFAYTETEPPGVRVLRLPN